MEQVQIIELKKVRSSPNFFKVEFTLSLHRKYDGSRQKQEREGSSNLYHDFLRLREPPRDWQRLASLTHHLSGSSAMKKPQWLSTKMTLGVLTLSFSRRQL